MGPELPEKKSVKISVKLIRFQEKKVVQTAESSTSCSSKQIRLKGISNWNSPDNSGEQRILLCYGFQSFLTVKMIVVYLFFFSLFLSTPGQSPFIISSTSFVFCSSQPFFSCGCINIVEQPFLALILSL